MTIDEKEEATGSIAHASPIDRKSQQAECSVFEKPCPMSRPQGLVDTLAQNPLGPPKHWTKYWERWPLVLANLDGVGPSDPAAPSIPALPCLGLPSLSSWVSHLGQTLKT